MISVLSNQGIAIMEIILFGLIQHIDSDYPFIC